MKETKTGIDNSLANRRPLEQALSYEQFLERVKKSKLMKIAEYIETPKDYPCDVIPSKYIFMIKKEINGKWFDEGRFILIPPI